MMPTRAPRVSRCLGTLLVVVVVLLGAAVPVRVDAAAGAIVLTRAAIVPDVAGVPQKARDVLAQIEQRHGKPPPGYVGGRAFQNRERHLPRGVYREYDVNPKVHGRDRGAERIVIERRSGRAYYTPDHYETFLPMN